MNVLGENTEESVPDDLVTTTIFADDQLGITGKYILPTTIPTIGQFILADGSPQLIFGAGGAGSGDVLGPVSSVDNEVVLYNSTTGKVIKNSGTLITDLTKNPLDRTLNDATASEISVRKSHGPAGYVQNGDQISRYSSSAFRQDAAAYIYTGWQNWAATEDHLISSGSDYSVAITNNGDTTPTTKFKIDTDGVHIIDDPLILESGPNSMQLKADAFESLGVYDSNGEETFRFSQFSYVNFANNSIQGLGLVNNRGRGTLSVPTAVKNGDICLATFYEGHDGNSYEPGITIETSFTEDWSPTNRGASYVISSVNNTESVRSERFRIDSDGTTISTDLKLVDGANSVVLKAESTDGDFSTFKASGGKVANIGIFNYRWRYVNTPQGLGEILYKARGTEATPLAVLNGDSIREFTDVAHNGVNFNGCVNFRSQCTEDWSVGNNGASYTISTTNNGQSVMSERFRIDSSGVSVSAPLNVDEDIQTTGSLKSIIIQDDTSGVGLCNGAFTLLDSTGASVHSISAPSGPLTFYHLGSPEFLISPTETISFSNAITKGTHTIGDGATRYVFPSTKGTDDQYLKLSGNDLVWSDPGNKAYTIGMGGNANTAGIKYMKVWGTATTSSDSTIDERNSAVIPIDSSLVRIAYNTQSGDVTSQFGVLKNGVSQLTFFLDSLSGIETLNVDYLASDTLEFCWTGVGTQPLDVQVVLYFEAPLGIGGGGGGSGDVVGPGSSTNNAISRYDGGTGKLIQDSGVVVNDDRTLEYNQFFTLPSKQAYTIYNISEVSTVVTGVSLVSLTNATIGGAHFFPRIVDGFTWQGKTLKIRIVGDVSNDTSQTLTIQVKYLNNLYSTTSGSMPIQNAFPGKLVYDFAMTFRTDPVSSLSYEFDVCKSSAGSTSSNWLKRTNVTTVTNQTISGIAFDISAFWSSASVTNVFECRMIEVTII